MPGTKQGESMTSVPQLLLVLVLYTSYNALNAHAGDEQSYKVLVTSSLNLKPEAVCSEPKVSPPSSSGTTVPLNHRHGPCSPVPSDKKPTLDELLRRDQLRGNHVLRKLSTNHRAGGLGQSDVTVPTKLGVPLNTLEYVVTVGLGSPAVMQTLIMDTGSDVSWVHCHSPSGSPYDPSKSSTYAPVPCGDAACTQLGAAANGCSNSQCQYIVRYADGANTTGTYSSDTLALASTNLNGFQFGCSHDEEGLDDKTDGLLGLGGAAPSLVSQTTATYGMAFSYCLPPSPGSSGFLTLGLPSSMSGFQTTRMLKIPGAPTFYFALLQGIGVGGKLLSVPPTVFSGGSLMDSGTIITSLPPTAYAALSTAFKAGMTQYPSAPPWSIFDTCFNFTGQDVVTIPSVSLVFDGGAVVNLDPNGIILDSCLAFTASGQDGSIGIIGNVQQRTFEVLYFLGQSVLGFRPNAC